MSNCLFFFTTLLPPLHSLSFFPKKKKPKTKPEKKTSSPAPKTSSPAPPTAASLSQHARRAPGYPPTRRSYQSSGRRCSGRRLRERVGEIFFLSKTLLLLLFRSKRKRVLFPLFAHSSSTLSQFPSVFPSFSPPQKTNNAKLLLAPALAARAGTLRSPRRRLPRSPPPPPSLAPRPTSSPVRRFPCRSAPMT